MLLKRFHSFFVSEYIRIFFKKKKNKTSEVCSEPMQPSWSLCPLTMNFSLQRVNKKVLSGFVEWFVVPMHHLLFISYIFLEIVPGLWEFGDLGHELHHFDIRLQDKDPKLSSSLYLFLTSWIWKEIRWNPKIHKWLWNNGNVSGNMENQWVFIILNSLNKMTDYSQSQK